jgi:hypothetical protein
VRTDEGGASVRTTTKVAVAVATLSAAAACGGSSSGGSGGGGQPSVSAGPPQHPASLVGDVGKNDAFTISLTTDTGAAVANVAAGSYKLVVHDLSGIHNFHLTGSGVNDLTSVQKAETKTFTVALKPGTYTFLCDAHPSTMTGTFTVS